MLFFIKFFEISGNIEFSSLMKSSFCEVLNLKFKVKFKKAVRFLILKGEVKLHLF